jgi:uncharacterized DUF497 family protein
MTRITEDQLIWDSFNINHFKKHNLSVQNILSALSNIVVHRKGYNNRFIILARMDTRILAIIIAAVGKRYYIVTARDADKKERKLVYEKEKNNS